MNKTFAKRLKEIREMSGLTQAELAAKAGVVGIPNMECGAREPSLDSLIKIVKALGVSADVLLGTARP